MSIIDKNPLNLKKSKNSFLLNLKNQDFFDDL